MKKLQHCACSVLPCKPIGQYLFCSEGGEGKVVIPLLDCLSPCFSSPGHCFAGAGNRWSVGFGVSAACSFREREENKKVKRVRMRKKEL